VTSLFKGTRLLRSGAATVIHYQPGFHSKQQVKNHEYRNS